MQASTQRTRTLGGLPYKWTVVIVTIFGLFMYVLDSTIVNIAIPRLQTDFGAPLYSVQWVSTGYSLAGAVATPLTPFLSSNWDSNGSTCWRWPSSPWARPCVVL